MPPKLLIVDDRRENLIALAAVLKTRGYEFVEALSGQEALEQVHLHDFVAILLDVQMPGLDGFETAKLIRKVERARTTPIIFVTAIHRTEAYEEQGYVAGAVDYLFKPINVEILQAKLAVFTELYQKNIEIQKQSRLLRDQAIKQKEYDLLKEALRSRDEFLSMASHELKTPITPLNLQMQAFLQMLEEGTLDKASPERLKRMLTTSCSQVERLSRMIDDLLDVSRFTTGRVEMNVQEVDLVEVVRKVLGSFVPQLRDVGCNYILEAPTSIFGHWDSFRIEQVFMNVLSNAMKYGSGKPILINLYDNGDQAELRIKDYGIGIAPEDHDRIFKRFERAVSPRNYGGLGLGLFISSEIVKHHGGLIEVRSQLGEGAEFIIQLPKVFTTSQDSQVS